MEHLEVGYRMSQSNTVKMTLLQRQVRTVTIIGMRQLIANTLQVKPKAL